MRKIEVLPYDPHWADIYAAEAQLLKKTLSPLDFTAHHIGSTSVPGLAAKSIIDILIEVKDVSLLDEQEEAFASIGYEAMGEFGLPGRRFFRKGGDNRTHHIHSYSIGDKSISRHLAFRDYMRANPNIAQEFAELKLKVASDCNNDINIYMDGKDAFIKHHEAIAVEQYKSTT